MLNNLFSTLWISLAFFRHTVVVIFYYLFSIFFCYLIYYFCLIAYYLNNNSKFLKRSRKEVLTLISGGPCSGKKLLLTFLKEKLWAKENKIFKQSLNSSSYFNFFDSNFSYDIDKKKWKENYFSFDSEENNENEKIELVFVNELEDCPLNLNSENFINEKKDLISKIYSLNYFRRRAWIAFSKRDGFLWNNIICRSNSIINCREVIEKKFLGLKIFRYYIIKISVIDSMKISKAKEYSLIASFRIFLSYEKTWSEELLKNKKILENKRK